MPKVTEAHSAFRRRQIIDAAYRCFARKGFHQATMRDIYEEAKLSPGAVYHYFPSKDAIIQASFEFDYQRIVGLLDAAIASADPLQALINPPLLESISRVIDQYLAALSQIVRRAQAAGQIDGSLDPRAVSRMVLSLYSGLELQKALDPALEVAAYAEAVRALLRSAMRIQ